MRGREECLSATLKKRVELRYLVYTPESAGKRRGKLPLILFLHGAGERGNDLNQVKRHGPPRVCEEGERLPFLVVAPQCPAGAWWDSDSLTSLVDHLLASWPVDRRRVYLTGLSMGGHGTWMLAHALPDRFAAIAPICGPFAFVEPTRFVHTAVWCFHGAMDTVVPLESSTRMVRWLRENGARVRFTVYPNAGHDAWTRTYRSRRLYDWFLAHARTG